MYFYCEHFHIFFSCFLTLCSNIDLWYLISGTCQVFPFGSVPLKTYLPDGDIDLTAISELHRFNDTWANDVSAILEHEERNREPEFHVKEVKCIYAEV